MPASPRTPPASSPRPTLIGGFSRTNARRRRLESGLVKRGHEPRPMVGIAEKRAKAVGIEERIQLAQGRYRTGGILGSASLGVNRGKDAVSEGESRIARDTLLHDPR